MTYIYQSLEEKYEGISKNFNLEVKETKNSNLLYVIFSLNKSKITDNVNEGFLNCLILKGDVEQLYVTLLNIPKV